MVKLVDRLDPLSIKAYKPEGKPIAHLDGNGLTLMVMPSGAKLWWLRYRFGGKRLVLSLGQFPTLSLAKARELAKVAREKIALGIDPGLEKKLKKLELRNPSEPVDNSFKAIALEWLKRKEAMVSAKYHRIMNNRLEDYIFPQLGNMPINEITPQILEVVLKEHEKKEVFETINRTNKYCSEIFIYGYGRPAGRVCDTNPAEVVHKWLTKPKKRTYPTIAGERDRDNTFKKLLLDIENYSGRVLEKYAMQIMAHTFVRTHPLVHAEWSEFDLVRKEWLIPAEKMKGQVEEKQPLLVPLSRQVITILKNLKAVSGGNKYLFPHRSKVNGHANENMILKGLERMGWKGKMSGHGFRHVASTTLNEYKEKWKINSDWIEIQISHTAPETTSRGTYNLAIYIDDRRRMLQRWSDFIDELTGNKASSKKK